MLVSVSSYRSLSLKSGVYLFLNQNNEVLYIGKAKSLKKRVSSYFTNSNNLGPKTKLLVSNIKKIKTITVASEIEALLLEANYIKKYKPKYNTRLTDGKAYPLIRITVKDKYPKVLIVRKVQDKKSIYFGPFPNPQVLRLVLKTVRRIFPFQSSINHQKKLCLYHHLGLCPCPEVFADKAAKDTPWRRSILVKEYRRNISYIIDFLNGKTKKIVKDLKVERHKLSKLEEFEKAALVQKKLDAIELITNKSLNHFDYKINPNLNQDILNEQLSDLKKSLCENDVYVESLERIECYDISNTSGKQATGSMVVLIRGEIDLSLYRRFKIRNSYVGPDDFAMMQEVISRRLNHKEWAMPNLIIVDGGKGQVSSALEALKEKDMQIPVIGLAKREEAIITSDFKEINLPKDSEALHLLQLIRDEAHRFAIFYHRKLRSNILYK